MPKNNFWAGSDTSYREFVEAEEKFSAMTPEAFGGVDLESEQEAPRLYSTVGDVGLITISGALVSKESWWVRWSGMTSYEAIREAVIFALGDTSISTILMDISSPGGAVAGCEEIAALIKRADELKPISVFSDGSVSSAAYWIASAARARYSSKSAIWGSLGVIMRHAENSRMRNTDGITDTIFRSGPWKGLGGTTEKLSTLAKEDFQGKTDYLAQVFIDSVAENLNITAAYVDEAMGKGREFIGQQAVDVGFCTSIESFDAVIGKLQEAVESAGGLIMPKKGLTPQAIAALAAGASPEAEASSGKVEAGEVKTAESEASSGKVKTSEAGAEASSGEVKDGEGKTPEAGAELTSALAKVELLAEQLATVTSEVTDLKLQAEAQTKQAEAVEPLKVIASTAISNMQVAMGSATTDLSAYSAEALVQLHGATTETFTTTFQSGGLTTEASVEQPTKAPSIANLDSVGL